MKKYNKPEIEALALETIDVIETSSNGIKAATDAMNAAAAGTGVTIASTQKIEDSIEQMETTFSW